MSWQGYVDNLMGTKHITACGIFGHDGSVWAASPGYPLSADNIRLIISGTSDNAKISSGVQVGADRYILVRGDPGSYLILKKGPNGIVSYKSNQACIIATHDQNTKAEMVLTDVGKIIDYLTKHGY